MAMLAKEAVAAKVESFIVVILLLTSNYRQIHSSSLGEKLVYVPEWPSNDMQGTRKRAATSFKLVLLRCRHY